MVAHAHFVTDLGCALELLHQLATPPSIPGITLASTRLATPHHPLTDPERSSDVAEH